jgi:putative ABC transport system ATP-binding protein
LADEPTGKLDTSTAREIFTLFREIVEGEGATILIATHDPLVDKYVDGVLQLSDGQITERDNRPGTVQNLASV